MIFVAQVEATERERGNNFPYQKEFTAITYQDED